MAKMGYIDPKWYGKPIYRYHLKSSQHQQQYRFVSLTIQPKEAIGLMKNRLIGNSVHRLYCNGELIFIYKKNIKGIKNKKTGDIWESIEEFCIDNDFKRKQATEVIRRKTDIYEYIYFDN
jgi:hypothetical protein